MTQVPAQNSVVKTALAAAEAEYARLCEAEHAAAAHTPTYRRAYEARKRAKVRLYYMRGGTRPFADGVPQPWIDEERDRVLEELEGRQRVMRARRGAAKLKAETDAHALLMDRLWAKCKAGEITHAEFEDAHRRGYPNLTVRRSPNRKTRPL